MCHSAMPATLGGKARLGQGVIQVARLAIEDIGVRAGTQSTFEQIGVTGALDGGDGVFLGIGVQVADDQEVGISAVRRIGKQARSSDR